MKKLRAGLASAAVVGMVMTGAGAASADTLIGGTYGTWYECRAAYAANYAALTGAGYTVWVNDNCSGNGNFTWSWEILYV